MFRIIGETHINFIGVRKIAFTLSTILVIIGIVALVMIFSGKGNMGIDFAGGTLIIGSFNQPVHIDDLRAAITPEFPEAQMTELSSFEKPNAFVIKAKRPATEQEGKERAARLKQIVSEKFPNNPFTVDSEHIIGPAVGQSLRSDAQKAVLLSLIGIVIYIWIRFDFRAGVAAGVATLHDVLALLGITWLIGFEFDLLLVSALLTIAGYSLTDTVVVYDRIRENLKKFRSKGEYASAVNASINEVLSRTINTSLTTLLAVVALFLFGGETLRTFTASVIMGVIIGTYSSWYVASPIIVEWEARRPSRFK